MGQKTGQGLDSFIRGLDGGSIFVCASYTVPVLLLLIKNRALTQWIGYLQNQKSEADQRSYVALHWLRASSFDYDSEEWPGDRNVGLDRSKQRASWGNLDETFLLVCSVQK